jgi:hypothetical protein
MQRILRAVPNRIWTLAIFFTLSYCSSTFAIDPTSTDPIYCRQGECLYCDESGCAVVPTDVDESMNVDSTDQANDLDALSTDDVSQMLAEPITDTTSPDIHEKLTTLNGKLHKKMKALTPQVKKVSHRYTTKLNKDAHTTYEMLKKKNQQMLRSRHQNTATTKQAGSKPEIPPVNQQPKKVASIKSRPIKKQAIKKLPRSKPLRIEPISVMPTIFHYKPSIDFAQYAAHQGNSRSANLLEGFIPLGKFTFDRVLFLDLRYYHPNGIPYELNADLAFRQLPLANFLWGIYTGYDRFRSDSTRYFSQINGGLELWFHRLFFGANVYIPVATKEYDNIHEGATLVPTSISYRYNIAYEDEHDERVLPGGDVELGLDITHGLTIYGGGYYFHHSGFSTIAGPKLRATYTFYRSTTAHRLLGLFDRIRLEGSITHDKPRGTSWLFGIRFTLGLDKQPNPSSGLLRHMADPIRRDVNGISEAFNTEDLLRDSNGNIINVDIPNGSDLTISAAIADETSEIVGVRGTQTTSSTLGIGDHELTITGGIYYFTVGNHTYSVQIGIDGVIKQNAGVSTALMTMDGAQDTTIEQITLSVNNGNNTDAIIFDDPATNNLGTLTIDDVTSNGSLLADLASSQSATISLTSSQFSTTNDETSAISLTADDGDITITNFKNNTITTTGDDAPAIANQATSASGNITYTGQFTQNAISTTGNSSTAILNQSDGGNINYSSSFTENEINTSGTGTDIITASDTSAGIYNNASNSGTITFGSTVTQNTIETDGVLSAAITNVSSSSGQITYAGDFNTNGLTTTASNSIALLNQANGGDIDYSSNFNNNDINTSGNGSDITSIGSTAAGIYNHASNSGTLTFGSTVNQNTIETDGVLSAAITNVSNSSGQITYTGNFNTNGLTTTGNRSIALFNQANGGDIDYSSNFNNNEIATSGDGSDITSIGSTAAGIYNHASNSGTLTFGSTVNQNTIETDGEQAAAIINVSNSSGQITYTGNFNTNGLTTTGDNSIALLNQANGGDIDYSSNFINNEIDTSGAGTDSLTIGDNASGIYNEAIANTITFGGNVNNNMINTTGAFAADIVNLSDDSGTITYSNAFSTNTLTTTGETAPGILNTAGPASSAGTITYGGSFDSNNIETSTTVAGSSGIGNNASAMFNRANGSSASVNFNGSFTLNVINTAAIEAFGVNSVTKEMGEITYAQALDNNTLIAENAPAIHIDSTTSGQVTFEGGITNNTLNTLDTSQAVLRVLVSGGSGDHGVATFLVGITDNTFSSGNSPGIFFATIDGNIGTINVAGASSGTALANDNTNATYGTSSPPPTINWNY